MSAEPATLLECDDARGGFFQPEQFTLIDVVNESIRVNRAELHRHRVHVVRHFHALPTIRSERHKVLQILSTLIQAADDSIGKLGRHEAKLTIRVETRGDQVRIEIEIEGVVVPRGDRWSSLEPEHGQQDLGHKTQLAHSAMLAKELGGRLAAFGAGAGAAATYRLELPLGGKGGLDA